MSGVKMLRGGARLWAIAVFCLGAVLVMGIYLGRLSAQKAAEVYVSDMLGRFGAVSKIVPEEYWGEAALAFAKRYGSEDILRGQELLQRYGYSLDMQHEYTVDFWRLRKRQEAVWAFFGAAVFAAAAAVFLGHEQLCRKRILKVCTDSEGITRGEIYSEDGMLTGISRYVSGSMARISRYAENLRNSLKKEEDYIGGLISDISHQMKTPVAALVINCEIMLREPDMEVSGRLDFLRRCMGQLDRLNWLIAGLLKSARLDSGEIEFDMRTYSLSEAVGEAAELHRQAAAAKGIEIADRTPPGIMIKMDRRWLCEAFGNIIKNAVEYTGEGGRIEIDGSETPLTARVSISDNGKGIPPELLPKIFDRFCSLSAQGTSVKNVGLGLSVSRSIIHRHNGNIRVESKQGRGTVFEITFVRSGDRG